MMTMRMSVAQAVHAETMEGAILAGPVLAADPTLEMRTIVEEGMLGSVMLMARLWKLLKLLLRARCKLFGYTHMFTV